MRHWLYIVITMLMLPLSPAFAQEQTDSTGLSHADSIALAAAAKARAVADSAMAIANAPSDSVMIDAAKMVSAADSLIKDHFKGKKAFVPNPKLALWFSLIPGGGQIYNRKYWKLPIVYGGFFGCIYALNWNNRMYQDYQRAYVDIMDDDPETKSYMEMLPLNYDMTGKEERFKSIFKSKKDYYRKYRDMSIFIMIGVWALATIDAYVDAELSTYDITKDLTLRIQPAIFNSDRADMCGTRFGQLNGGVMFNLTF